MKVNGNDPTLKLDVQKDGGFLMSSIPIRLEIASRIAAGLAADPNFVESCSGDYANLLSKTSFKVADRLIAKHNETCGGE